MAKRSCQSEPIFKPFTPDLKIHEILPAQTPLKTIEYFLTVKNPKWFEHLSIPFLYTSRLGKKIYKRGGGIRTIYYTLEDPKGSEAKSFCFSRCK